MLITTVPLLPTLFADLYRYSPRMMEILRCKGGAAGRKIRHLMVAMSKVCIKMGRPMLIKYFLCPCHDNCMSIILYTYGRQTCQGYAGFNLIKILNHVIILITSALARDEEVIGKITW